jgi:hypothetical protein
MKTAFMLIMTIPSDYEFRVFQPAVKKALNTRRQKI